MARHTRIIRVNPYINRHGKRRRYCPNRAKQPRVAQPMAGFWTRFFGGGR